MKIIIFSIVVILTITSCRTFQIGVDNYSLNRNKEAILKNFAPGNPEYLQTYITNYDLDKLTRVSKDIKPEQIIPLDTWHIKTEKKINYEKWIFNSSFFENSIPGSSVFYILQQKPWKDSRVILFVPGFGVSDFAFRFLKKFFLAQINEGYNIVIYIPPYHMDRQKSGEYEGRGLLNSSPLENVRILTNSVKELREVYQYLENLNIRSTGLWGGSMGGAFSILLQSLETFDHLALMIPVIDWNSFITPESVLPFYREKGFNEELIKNAFSLISPVNYKLNIPGKKIQIEAAEFDQLNPIAEIINYASENRINNLNIYPSGHATILLYNRIYRDYAEFLSDLQ